MDSKLENGDYVLEGEGLQTICDVDALIQSLYLSLVIPKGSFALNKELGSDIFELRATPFENFKFEFERILREVLLDFDDVLLQEVEYVDEEGRIVAKINVLVDDERRTLDFEFKKGVN
jgi:hypothetical protein